ncbi:hypothetical protein BJX66DRAFT_308640 [Aspergillus keveii]|uniref:Uncharacterized protein n=1 Tax=Aspergillus keveii TaxID=714993 RepID=A0ABR4FYY4_9EURO
MRSIRHVRPRNKDIPGRATSSHLHVVPAGNSQRNSLAVSECQEELNNAIFPLFHDAPTRRKPSLRISRNAKHHRTSTREEAVRASHTYAPRRRTELVTPFIPPENHLRFPS